MTDELLVNWRVPHPAAAAAASQAIATQPLLLPDDVTISPHLADLFMRMFDKDPRTRITLQVSTSRAGEAAAVGACSRGCVCSVVYAVVCVHGWLGAGG